MIKQKSEEKPINLKLISFAKNKKTLIESARKNVRSSAVMTANLYVFFRFIYFQTYTLPL